MARSIAKPFAVTLSMDMVPSLMPRQTMAVLMNHSGLHASLRKAAKGLKKFPIASPTRRAMMKPVSSPSDKPQVIPSFSHLLTGAEIWASLPMIQQAQAMTNSTVHPARYFFRSSRMK